MLLDIITNVEKVIKETPDAKLVEYEMPVFTDRGVKYRGIGEYYLADSKGEWITDVERSGGDYFIED